MAGGEIGYYTLPVIVSFKGIDAQVEDKLGKSIKDLGKKTGEDLGTAVVAGLDPTKSPKVNNAIKGSAGAGKKMGDAITTEVAKNIDGKKISDKMSATVQDAVTKGDAGKKMGEAVSTGVAKNFDPKVLGKKIEEGLTRAQNLDTKKVGKKIEEGLAGGIDGSRVGGALKDFLKQPMAEATQVAKDWGKQVGTQILAGDIKGAAGDVDAVIKNTTGSVTSLGKMVGLNLDSVEQFGNTAVTKIDSLASTAQGVVDKITGTVTDVKATRDAIRSLTSGDTTSRLKGVSTLLDTVNTGASHLGVDASGVTKPLQQVTDAATTVADLGSSVKELKTLFSPGAARGAAGLAGEAGELGAGAARGGGMLAGLLGGGEGVAGAGAAIGAAFGPAIAGAAILAGGVYLQNHVEEFWPPGADKKHGEIDYGPTPPTPEQLAQNARNAPAGPNRLPREGYSWQQDANGQWVERPMLGAPGAATPGYVAPGAAPPPPVEAAPDAELDALNKARAAKGLPSVGVPGVPAPRPAPAPAPAPYYAGPPTNQPTVPETFPATAKMAPGLEKFAATVGQAAVSAQISAQSASINVGSATISGVSVGVPVSGSSSSPQSTAGRTYKYATGGEVPIIAHGGEHVFTKGDVDAMGGQAGVYQFRQALHYQGGGEVRDIAGAIAPEVAAAAAEGAAKGAAAAAGAGGKPAGGGSPLQAFSGGVGSQGGQDSLQFLTNMLGVGASGAGEELGLGTVFPDPMANPNVKSIMGLFSALSGPIKGAMAGKLGIQQPGWRPGMPVAAMANNQQPAGSIGLPFGLPSIDIPAAPAPGPPEAPGGGPGGAPGPTYNVDASINYHDGSVLGVDPAAQRATDMRTQERNLAPVAPVDPGNH